MPHSKHRKPLSTLRSTSRQSEFAELISRYPRRTSIVAEGDSWFVYPRKWLFAGKPNNIINYLKNMERFNLLQLASNGSEAVAMLSGDSKVRLLQSIHRNNVDFLLFSGGGNDIVGRWDFDYFLKDRVNSKHFEDYLHKGRLTRRIAQITHAYEDLIDYCTAYSQNPAIRIITHTYDYLVPNPQGAEFFGGLFKPDRGQAWLYPFLIEKQVPEALHAPLVRYLVDRLAECLLKLQDRHAKRLVVVDTRGLIDPTNGWLNEIHPKPGGFKNLAEEIYAEIKLQQAR